MGAESEPPDWAQAAADPAAVTDDHAVYVYGVQITGLPGLPASPDPPRLGSRRTLALRAVGETEISERWQPRQARRIVERRWPDGSLALAVDEDRAIGYRIDAPEVGVHLVSTDGTEVLVPEPQAPDWFWQRLLFAQTLPIAATLQGLGLFHASAVRIGEHAVGVSAPSGTGKSSTATHLIAQGAEFFTDDVLAMEPVGGAVLAFAGPEFANIEEHELDAVEPSRRERLGQLLGESGKQHLRPTLSQTSLPLGALYLLERDPEVDEVQVEALDGSGIAALLAAAFIPHLRTEGRLVGHLELCGQMVTAGLIYRVRAPLRGSAAAVAAVVMDHVRQGLSEG
jgi:hypothetical protein